MIESSEDILDVAVVGGGVAGAYAAWRLLCDHPPVDGRPLKIALFEGSDRIGGRLLSVKPPGMDQLVCELGGMYFTSVHPLVRAVSRELGLSVQEIPHVKRDTLYLRRRRFHQDIAKVPYDFDAVERTMSPDALLPWALDKAIPGITKLQGRALDEALEHAVVRGLPAADWGFWNLLCLALSSEGFAYSRDSNPDDYMLVNWNSVDAIRGMQIFSQPVKVFHLTRGYDELPRTLADRAGRAGAKVLERHRLKSVEMVAPDLVRLHVARESKGWGPAAEGEPTAFLARRVILALPKRSLELVQQTGPLFENPGAQALFGSVTTIPMFKMFSCYASPWWEKLGFDANGIAVTDMPLKACLYWGTEGDQPGGDPKNENSLLLTSLEDMATASFWTGLRAPRENEPIFGAAAGANALLHGHAGGPEWRRYADSTSARLVEEAQRQLSEVHGIDVPEPYAAASKDWTADPFGGALSQWNIGARSEKLMPKITQPVSGLPIYVCGESYSRTQGWVEGALETAELMLEQHFGLTRPAWLTKDSP